MDQFPLVTSHHRHHSRESLENSIHCRCRLGDKLNALWLVPGVLEKHMLKKEIRLILLTLYPFEILLQWNNKSFRLLQNLPAKVLVTKDDTAMQI